MDFNTEENRKVLIGYFPHLGSDSHFELLSEQTPVYNCIAWAMGYSDRWVDTEYSPGHWWPAGVKRSTEPIALFDAFVAEGFEKADDGRFEKGYDKVVLFQKDGEWTHASRIESNEVEYSKFGGSFDGVHSHNIFTGSIYGEEYAYLRRKTSAKPIASATPQGSIKINLDNLIF